MVDLRGGASLDEKALGALSTAPGKELDRDEAAQASISSEEHLAHPASTQRTDDLVMLEKRACLERARLAPFTVFRAEGHPVTSYARPPSLSERRGGPQG